MRKIFLCSLPLFLLSACGSVSVDDYLPDQRLAYKKQREASENLEIPPDLVSGQFDDAMDVPDLGGSATYSEYLGERKHKRQLSSAGQVLPEVKNIVLKRDGDRRWLEIAAPPQKVWPRLIAFWREQGILLTEQDPMTGVMKTDWLENRADIPKDIVTNTLRKVVDGLYATATRDQYRVRIEPGERSGTTDLYLSHREMTEHLVSNTVGEDSNTIWEPSGSDPDKEAVMLRRLMVFLGVTEARAKRVLAEQTQTHRAGARLVQDGGESYLLLEEEFRRAWNGVGLALDRVGFAVEDRDRSQGIYYVRYDDPSKGQKKKGFLSKFAFWDKEEVDTVQQYQVRLIGKGKETRVSVYGASGRPDHSATGQRILQLLQEQLR